MDPDRTLSGAAADLGDGRLQWQEVHLRAQLGGQVFVGAEDLDLDLEGSLLTTGFRGNLRHDAVVEPVRVGLRTHPAFLPQGDAGQLLLVHINLDLEILQIRYGKQRGAGAP